MGRLLSIAALTTLVAVASAEDLCSLPNNKFVCYKLHPSFLSDLEPDWPSGMPKGTASLSAVGVDPSAPGGAEIYVSQRGGGMKGIAEGPILVFNENGDLIRQFGLDRPGLKDDGHIVTKNCPGGASATCPGGKTYGGHGLSVKPDAGQGASQIWINDFYECVCNRRSRFPPRALAVLFSLRKRWRSSCLPVRARRPPS